jgi:hypothetical protein
MLILTATRSENELLSGIPEYVSLVTNQPATIFYTLDNTEPNVDSLIATGDVFLPTSGSSVILRAKAITMSEESEELALEYSTSSIDFNGRRLIGEEGIAVLRAGDVAVNTLAYDAAGNPVQGSSTQFVDLDLKASRTDKYGVVLDENTTSLDFVNFPDKPPPFEPAIESTPNNNSNFDPKAKFIIIDGSTDEARDNQVVKVVNRPYNTFGPTSRFYQERLGIPEPIITGNYVRSFYNPVNKKYCSYYWENLESRWILSIQTADIPNRYLGGKPSRNRYVYQWIQDRAYSLIF